MIDIVTVIVLIVMSAAWLAVSLRRDMQMFQQNSYRNDRYLKWLRMSGDSSSIARITTLASLFLILAFPYSWGYGVAAGLVAALAVVELRRKYKHNVVFTKRVWRLFSAAVLLCAAMAAAVAITDWRYLPHILLVEAVLSWVISFVANTALAPVERSINQSYVNDAKRLLADMPEMKVVGVTGSYGKTSTKHYLNRILQEKYNVLMTPGSYNTPMGVVRTIREMMKPYNDLFICEMGAKQVGDIKEICDIVRPSVGIVTAVGPQHLESFKTIENVQRTKFELVDALPADGFAVLNNDFEWIARRPVDNVKCSRYAVAKPDGADYHAENIEYSAQGTTFDIVLPDGTRHAMRTRLVGECNISNLLAAIITGLYLEVPIEKIQYAVSKIEQVEHRLNMKRTAGGITIIDDAFNSNPDGSRMALDVLSRMTGGKRIVITPGMIELGDKQQELNREFGRRIAKAVDVAIIVGEYNREAILAGIDDEGMKADALIVVNTFAEAQQQLAAIATAGDTVLYENDLPDTFK